MMKRPHIDRILSLLLLLISAVTASAESGVKKLHGEFTYYGDKNESREQCRLQALQGARVQALATEFGTIVSQDTYQRETMDDRDQSTYFSSLSLTSVKGEWIADEGEPHFEYSLDTDGCYVVRCKISGTARAISNEAVEFEALVLRNGTERRHSDTRFRSGDDMYLYFRAPVDGYVACYLADDKETVYSLLPYQETAGEDVKIKRGRTYVFFSPELADREHGVVDELIMTSDGLERNSLYIIFSPKPYSRTLDMAGASMDAPRSLNREDFSRWLARARRNDPRMGVKIINIEITNE